MLSRLRFLLKRLQERLWVRPLAVCVLSIAAVFLARLADGTGLGRLVPDVNTDTVETLLKIVSASMLVIATFAVASMVSAYGSASSSATPRSFPLVVADDTSQNALSTFVGTFIFSIVALVALMNGYYDEAGRFTLFALTLFVFALVIATFVRWVDSIARLGRLSATVDKVEAATARAICHRRAAPLLGGVPAFPLRDASRAVYAREIGYVQRVDLPALQEQAEQANARITVAALPGTFSAPNRPVAFVWAHGGGAAPPADDTAIAEAFAIGDARTFDEDPRFGLVVLSEIASRALSPAVNDPGTAIDVIGTLVRLFALWAEKADGDEAREPRFDRVAVPELAMRDMFDDAFRGIARDGAGTVEVMVRLMKAFEALASLDDASLRGSALEHARLVLARAERALEFPPDLAAVREAAWFAAGTPNRVSAA